MIQSESGCRWHDGKLGQVECVDAIYDNERRGCAVIGCDDEQQTVLRAVRGGTGLYSEMNVGVVVHRKIKPV